MQEKFKALAQDPEFATILEEVKKDGMQAMMKVFQNEELVLKFNAKMGGLPTELGKQLQSIAERPMTLHEAAKNGDLESCKAYISKQNQGGVSIDDPNPNGITALGFAIGADRLEIVKLLLGCKA